MTCHYSTIINAIVWQNSLPMSSLRYFLSTSESLSIIAVVFLERLEAAFFIFSALSHCCHTDSINALVALTASEIATLT